MSLHQMGKRLKWNGTKLPFIQSFREIFNGMAKSLQAVGTDHLEIGVFNLLKIQAENKRPNGISMTDMEIANCLGTARVVVPRILNAFENEKKLVLKRGLVEILAK